MGGVLLNREFATFLRLAVFYISCPVVCSTSQQVFKRRKQQYGIQTLLNHKKVSCKALCCVNQTQRMCYLLLFRCAFAVEI